MAGAGGSAARRSFDRAFDRGSRTPAASRAAVLRTPAVRKPPRACSPCFLPTWRGARRLRRRPSPFGGVQRRCLRDSQLVDNADEGTGPYRGPDGEDSHADHSSLDLGDDDRRGGNEEQGAQVVGVVALVSLSARLRKNADGGVEIGETGAADVYLHEGLIGKRFAASDAAGRPGRGYHEPPLNPRTSGAVPFETRRKLLRHPIGRRYDAAHL